MRQSLQEQIRDTMKKLRLNKHTSVIDLAKAFGYETEKGYYDVESGRIDLKVKHVDAILEFYDLKSEIFLKR